MTLNMRFAIVCLTLFASSAGNLTAAEPSVSEAGAPRTLTITNPAPQLDIEHWLSPAKDGRGEVRQFENDKVYVVEFWATWCLPCIGSMPHLVELQEKFADRQVQIISVSQEPLETVTPFLKREVRSGENEQTYAELTSAYSLATDPDGSVYEDYMVASGRKTIPTAFVVGKTGQIEWIGHPMNLDEPLEAIVAGTWDVAAFHAEWEELQRQEAFAAKVKLLVRDGELESALQLVDQRYADDAALRADLRTSLTLLNLSLTARSGDEEKTLALIDQLLDQYEEDPERLVQLTNLLRSVHHSVPLPQPIVDRAVALLDAQIERQTGEALQQSVVSLGMLYSTLGDKEKALKALSRLPQASKSKSESN